MNYIIASLFILFFQTFLGSKYSTLDSTVFYDAPLFMLDFWDALLFISIYVLNYLLQLYLLIYITQCWGAFNPGISALSITPMICFPYWPVSETHYNIFSVMFSHLPGYPIIKFGSMCEKQSFNLMYVQPSSIIYFFLVQYFLHLNSSMDISYPVFPFIFIVYPAVLSKHIYGLKE